MATVNYNEHLIKDDDEYENEDEYDEEESNYKYPPISNYIMFCLMVNCQAIGFGTTVSFTGPTLDDISDDLNLCGNVFCESYV